MFCARPVDVTIAPDSPSMRCLSGSAWAIPLMKPGAWQRRRTPGDEDHRQKHGVDVGGGGVEVRDRVRERDPERGEAHHPAATNTTSSTQSFGHPVPKNTRPATVMIVICSAVLVTALPATPNR